MIVQKLFALQQPPFSCTKSSYGSKKFSTKQNSLSTSADSAYCQAIVYLTEAIIFHGQCFWVEKFSTSTAYGTKVLCLTEVSLLVHGQYLHGSKSFLQYWGSPLRLRTVLTIPSCFFFHKQYSAEANIILTGPTVLCLREAVLFVCGQCLRIQISEDVFLIWEEFL